MTVERIGREHLGQVAELERLSFAEPWSEKSLELLLGDLATGFVCVGDGRVLGYGGMMIAPDEGQITNVAVDPNARRQGLGRMIVDALTEEARTRGLEQISLEVRVSNQAAITLYERTGFEVAGRRKSFYRRPTEDALVMLKKIL